MLNFRDFYKFFQLSSQEKRLLLEASAALLVVVLSLKILGLQRSLKTIERMFDGRVASGTVPMGLENHSRAVDLAALSVERASRAVNAGTCLSKSLALGVILRRRGIATQLRIGVRKPNPNLSAHAWLEHEGRAIAQAGPSGCFHAVFPPIRAGTRT